MCGRQAPAPLTPHRQKRRRRGAGSGAADRPPGPRVAAPCQDGPGGRGPGWARGRLTAFLPYSSVHEYLNFHATVSL